MNRCVVIAAAPGLRPDWLREQVKASDFIICADGGYRCAKQAGLSADLILGDFDSSKEPSQGNVLRFPPEKDDTDTMLALKAGLDRGCRQFAIYGGIGSRLDHTFANLTALRFLKDQGAWGELLDEHNRVLLLKNESAVINAGPGQLLSVFSFDEECRGVTLEGMKYPLSDARLPQCPLGVSNVVLTESPRITVKNGSLLLFLSND